MQFTFSVVLTNGSNIATLTDVLRLIPSLFVYGSPIIPGTQIQSIDITHNTLILTNNSLIDFTGNLVFSDMTPEKYEGQCEALKEVQQIINSQGQFIQIVIRDETDIVRDDYNSITQRNGNPVSPALPIIFNVKAYPIKYNASRELKESLGFCDEIEVIVYTSNQDWIDNNYNYDDLDPIRSTVDIDNRNFKIREKTKYGHFSNNNLYVLLGLVSK